MKWLIIPFALILMPVIKFYTAIPGQSDCMIEYIKSGQQKAYVYSFGIGKGHIDTKDLGNKYKIGSAEGCIIKTGNIVTDFFNTQYCFTSKILIKYASTGIIRMN